MTSESSQFQLLRERRFAPLFWTQFFGAANDNLFKFAVTVMVTYQLTVSWLPPAMAGLVIGACFILPFLLFSATSGQLADRLDKARWIRATKWSELAIVLVAAWGLVAAHVPVLLGCIVLMGLQSTMFGPVKYAYLPQHLSDRELTGGNGMVETGTFIAILLGNVVGGLLIALPDGGRVWVAAACVLLSVAGLVASWRIPATPATVPDLPIRWNPWTETRANLRIARERPAVFRSLLGIAWLWFFGAVFLALLPAFARDVLQGDEQIASLLLVIFSIGIGVGSLACETLSRRQVEIGLVPLGAIGMTVFAIDLYLACRALPDPVVLTSFAGLRVLADLFLLSAAAGIFSVPMYALVQLRTPRTHTARIIAAGNILSAVLMIASALFGGGLLAAGLTIAEVFLVTGIVNAFVAAWIFMLVPEYLLRFLAWVLSHVVYRVRVTGNERIPAEGAAIIAANHVSFVDAVLLLAASPRPITFVMDHRIFRHSVLGPLFRLARAIPIAAQDEDPVVYRQAFERVRAVLADGGLVGIFPEGGLTRDGKLQPFKAGIMKILADHPAPVIPVALTGLWGSTFSRIEGGAAMTRPFRRGLFNRVGLAIGLPMLPQAVSPQGLQHEVAMLLEQDAPGSLATGV